MADIWSDTFDKLNLSPKRRQRAADNLALFRQKLEERFGKQSGGADTLLNVQGNKLIEYVSTNEGAAAFLATLPKFVFILKTIETSPGAGILVGVVMDAMLAGFSTAGEFFQNLVNLVPGFGPAIVAVFGIFFWPPLAMISFSRADFSEASEMYLKAIPLGIGKTLSTAFAKTDKFATKFGDKIGIIKEQSQQALGKLKDTLNDAKKNFEEKNEATIKHVRSRVDTATTGALNKLESGVEKAKESPLGQKVNEAFNREKAQFEAAREQDRSRVSEPTPATAQKPPYVPGSSWKDAFKKKKTAGRKRLSTKKRSNKKWSKTRRHRSVRR